MIIAGMVSIVIPIRRGEDIKEVRRSVERQTYGKIELVIVDEGLERSAQRNIGIRRSHGEYVFIVDSDQVLSDRLVEECVGKMDEYDALYVPEVIVADGWFSKYRNWERKFYDGTAVDCVRFVKRSICPLFDENMSGPEDSDWDRRVYGKRGITNNIFYHHDGVGIVKYFMKKIYYAKSMVEFEKKNRNDKVTNPLWRCILVFIEDGKWKRLVRSPIYTSTMVLVIGLRGIIYLFEKTHRFLAGPTWF